MSEPFVGEIRMFAGSFAPRGWAFCQGQLLPVQTNAALFSILGVVYGGDGRTNFGLPDLRGRVPVGTGAGPGGLTPIQAGQVAGTESVTILPAQMPVHSHGATATTTTTVTSAMQVAGTASNASATPSATNKYLGASVASGPPSASIWSDQLNNPVTLGNPETIDATVNVNVAVQPAGGGQPLPIRNPYLGINFIIALEGIYPPRN